MHETRRDDVAEIGRTVDRPVRAVASNVEVRSFLDSLIKAHGDDYASISRMLKRNASYVQQFIHRGTPRRLHPEDRKELAHYFGVDEMDLGGPPPLHAPPQLVPAESYMEEEPTAFLYVPTYDISASAGHGTLVGEEAQSGALAFRRDWIKSVSDAPVDKLAVLKIDGDSMYPTLAHGDHVLVDRQQSAPLRDGIYVLRIDDALQIKRLLVHPGTGKLKIKSDNPVYDHWSECDPGSLFIVGRAVWVGRRL